jgi:hypothetical protein
LLIQQKSQSTFRRQSSSHHRQVRPQRVIADIIVGGGRHTIVGVPDDLEAGTAQARVQATPEDGDLIAAIWGPADALPPLHWLRHLPASLRFIASAVRG